MSELFFSDLKFYILPIGIGKVRKQIFENQIKKHGGHVVNKVFEATHLIIEDSLDRCKLEKFVNEKDVRNLEIIKSLWLSKCFEQQQLIDSDSYKLKCSVKREDEELIDCCKRQKVENECLNNTQNNHLQDSGFSSENTSPIKNQTLNSKNWVCSYSSKCKPTNYNKHIIEKLEILAETYKNTKDHWRALGYQKALIALRNHPKPITNYEEALSLPGIGKSLANKIWEIIESGHLRKIDELCSGQKVEAINLFTKIWGAGPTTAEQWVQQGLYTLEDLNSKAKLSFQQKIGLKYFDDFLDRMPREEAKQIAETVKSVALSLNPGLIIEACGSYRRGKQTCGDLDILITHSDRESHKSILSDLINKLHEQGFLTDDLVKNGEYGTHRKYLGVCKLNGDDKKHRRIDIITVPYNELACAMLYFTGSAHFNRSMRLLARKKGMALSEHSLNAGVIRRKGEKICEGYALLTPTEESVFEHLGLTYRIPEERDH
ncbi:DNA polymerase lambda-like [Centruroides vittatus]|uniref:DNA polymerase lambda-like n=1 Tax=Centruroides vittatus TaxID=120091 RepID=UPI003510545A